MELENGWKEWSKHVLKELERFEEQHKEIQNSLTKLHVEIATLKVKSGVWGVIGGAIPVVVGLVVLKWGD